MYDCDSALYEYEPYLSMASRYMSMASPYMSITSPYMDMASPYMAWCHLRGMVSPYLSITAPYMSIFLPYMGITSPVMGITSPYMIFIYLDHSREFTAQHNYVDSVYWALATMTSTGYGDIHATNSIEKGYLLIIAEFISLKQKEKETK